ncbi:SBBP repeat-containing protein [Myxococcus xanthus]|uniref:SBBP repeat-containing protein n=1 Tax=Myxococcus xanthus TaxID=34 RepID=UPI001F1F1736|nr:SBBP repeat-containing protein [Myxococcus xanthus]
MVRGWQRWSACGVLGGWALLSLPGASIAKAPPLQQVTSWVHQSGGPQDELAQAVTTSGNAVYTAGYTSGQLGAEPSAGGQDAYVSKYDASGALLWTRQLGTSANDRALAVSADEAGNVYVAGYTWGSFSFYENAGGTDLFVAKYDAKGAFQWVRQFGTATDDYATGIAATRLASHDVVFVSGYSLGRFDGSAPQGNYDVVLAKFDAGGNPYWLRQFGSARSDVALGVAVSPNEDVYVTGYTYGSLDGVTNPGNTVDLFLTKYSVLGEPQWVRQLGSSHDEFGTGVAVADDGSVYVSGYTSGALEGSARLGSYDAVLVKYDTQGNWHWTRQIGTATTDYAQSVAVGKEGRVYLAGFTSGAMGGEPSLGSTDMFLATYDSHGTWLDFRQVGSASADRGQGVATAEDGAVYLVGYTLGQTSSFPSAGGYDAVLYRFLDGAALPDEPGPWGPRGDSKGL